MRRELEDLFAEVEKELAEEDFATQNEEGEIDKIEENQEPTEETKPE